MEEIELVPVFQPIVDTAGGIRVIGFEALIRGRGLLRLRGAAEVFAQASQFGGSKALDEQIRDLEIKSGLPLLSNRQRMFLNVSPHALLEPSWHVIRPAAKHLVLEVSEHARLSGDAISWLMDFKRSGVQIAIDDFGVGQTNLEMLAALKPDYLKLDLSFVRRGDFETVRKVRRFAEDWGSKLIVEGVETEIAAHTVMDAGVRYIQGFLYGRPREAHHWIVGQTRGVETMA